jgi:hypothetical protein
MYDVIKGWTTSHDVDGCIDSTLVPYAYLEIPMSCPINTNDPYVIRFRIVVFSIRCLILSISKLIKNMDSMPSIVEDQFNLDTQYLWDGTFYDHDKGYNLHMVLREFKTIATYTGGGNATVHKTRTIK